MKNKILYLVDHIHSDNALDQNCWIHNKDELSKDFDILFITRTIKPTFTKYRANFRIKAFNCNESYNAILNEIRGFYPDIVHVFGPLYFGETPRFINDLKVSCKIIQQYGGGESNQYWNDNIEYLIIDEAHEAAFKHVPFKKLVMRNNCCDLNFFKPIETSKIYDCVMSAGFYCSKGQDVVFHALKDTSLRAMFIGSHKSNLGVETEEYLRMVALSKTTSNIIMNIQDNIHPKDMPLAYNESRIFVWGSMTTYENPITLTNRSVTEAVACGLPVVGFKETFKNSNFIINNVNAFLVNTLDDFKSAVIKLVDDYPLRLKMGYKSRELAEQQLDFNKWHNQLLSNLYNKILHER